MPTREIKHVSDCEFDGTPECFHCDRELPPQAPAELQGNAVVVVCPGCGCLTPFPIAQEK